MYCMICIIGMSLMVLLSACKCVCVYQITKPLSKKLQGSSQDIYHATESIKDCQAVLQMYRDDDKLFARLFARATEMNGDEIAPPRVTGKQQNRTNVPAANAHEYYRRAVFLPFLDICMAQLHDRFQGDSAIVNRFILLLPKCCNRASIVEVEELTQLYGSFLPDGVTALETELLRWKSYWQRREENKRPGNVMEALRVASDLGTYPTLVILLRIFGTIPITTATAERSFSNLKFIKTYLRSTMTESRLNDLAHLFINRDIKLDYSKVIDQFGGEHNRRLKFT
jgi:hypothetical protein